MTFGEKLRAARKEKKLTQKALAALIQAAHNSISNWENDQNRPDPDTIQNLCRALGVTPNYFFLDEEPEEAPPAPKLPDNIRPLSQMRQIPLVGTIACGTPILAEENVESCVDMPEHVQADFALRCQGDSMINARIFDGDIVFIRQQPTVRNGEIAAVLINDEATLKRVYMYNERLELRPENPMFPVLNYEGEMLEQVRILGKAVAFTSRVR